MKIDIWSDVVCPWCYIGKRRFEAAVAGARSRHPDIELDITYHAFQLDPRAPVGAGLSVREVYEKKFGGPEAAQGLIDRVTSEAAGEGLEFRLDLAHRANTVLAHRLIAYAAREGRQADMKERLLAAYFTEGKAVGLPEVLVDLASDVGLDPDGARTWLDGDGGREEVAADLDMAVDRGITGVPTYVFNDSFGIPGAADTDNFERILSRIHLHETGATA